jgi:DDE superfamily endonuclease
MVLEANYEGRLMKQWEQYRGPAKVVFQPSHWMDSRIAIKYLDWLVAMYPHKKIGLLWDYAGAHVSENVLQHAKDNGIIVDFINKGMTSVQQPCDLYANQQIKQLIKEKYYEYRMTLSFEEQTKVKVPRELFVTWVEYALQQVHQSQLRNSAIRKTFEKCGLDPYDEEKVLFAKHLESLANESLYNALIQGQSAAELF